MIRFHHPKVILASFASMERKSRSMSWPIYLYIIQNYLYYMNNIPIPIPKINLMWQLLHKTDQTFLLV